MQCCLRPACAPAQASGRGPASRLATVLLLLILAPVGDAIGLEHEPSSTSAEARQEALRAIGESPIDPAYRQPVQQVLSDATLYRRLPTTVVDCHPELFSYMAQNPEVLVEIWRLLGVSQAQLTRTGDRTFAISDGGGTTGRMTVVELNCDDSAQNRMVMLVDGKYESAPFHRPITAQCVLLLRSGSMKEDDGRRYVAARLDSFVRFDRTSLELIAKAVHPLVGKTADRNFTDTLNFMSNFSYTAERRPDAVSRLVEQLDGVDAGKRRRLSELAYKCADESTAAPIRPVAAVEPHRMPR